MAPAARRTRAHRWSPSSTRPTSNRFNRYVIIGVRPGPRSQTLPLEVSDTSAPRTAMFGRRSSIATRSAPVLAVPVSAYASPGGGNVASRTIPRPASASIW